MAAHVDPEMVRQLNGDPDAELEAIVTARDEVDELLASLPADVVVRHRYRLIPGIAISAPVGVLRQLVELPTVKSIEPVRALRAF